MQAVIRASARHPWMVIAMFVVATLAAVLGAVRLDHEDDVFVFLPEDDPDVRYFREVSRDFGSLRVALIGAQVADDGDLLEPGRLAQLANATRSLAELPGVTRVTSLTTISDVTTNSRGAAIEPLVPGPPSTAFEHAKLRDRVLSRPLVVGSLISPDARATVLLVYVRDDVGTSEVVEQVRPVVEQELAGLELYYAGAPFAADSIYGEARIDVRRLSPLAAAVLVLVVLLSFRDLVGVLLTFFTVGFSTVAVLGVMGWGGERYTILTSTLPVLLLATGSAYAVHVLGRYYLEREHHDPPTALQVMAAVISRPIGIAAWTTIAAFLAFLVMDVRPMRAFGAEVALGTLLCWTSAITLVPAVLTLAPRQPSREQLLPFGNALMRGYRFVRRHRLGFFLGLVVVGVAALLPLPRVRARMEPQAFFREGSDPWRSHQFFEREFGGARFVQVAVTGDFQDPTHIRELARLVDYSRSIPGVTQVQSALDPLALTSDVLGGGRRLPATRAQSAQIFLFLDGEASFSSLMDPAHQTALVYLRVRGDAEPVIAAMEQYVVEQLRERPDTPSPSDVVRRVEWIAVGAGVELDEEDRGRLERSLLGQPTADGAWARERVAVVQAFLDGEEVEELSAAGKAQLLDAAKGGRDLREVWSAVTASADDAAFFHELLAQRLDSAQHEFELSTRVERVLVAAGIDPRDRVAADAVALAVADLELGDLAPTRARVRATVTGEPILDRALARSVQRNQVRTMSLGLLIVFALLVILFRSVPDAFICLLPAVLTAVIMGGVMGALDVEIDLSTAMVGAILTDTASDFGMHYLWYLGRDRPRTVVRTVGPIMIVSTVLVALGFFVFSLGSSPVLRLFGTLSGATCVVSAALACVVVPTLWRARRARDKASAPSPSVSVEGTSP